MRLFLIPILLTLVTFNVVASPPKIKFIENKGQWPSEVRYMTDIPGGKVFFKNDGLVYSFYDTEKIAQIHDHHTADFPSANANESTDDAGKINWHAINVNFLNANCNPDVSASRPLNTKFNYFFGDQVAASARAYEDITYKSLYDGIDVKFYRDNWLKYDILVGPEADPNQIALEYQGADEIYVYGGSLFIKTSVNTVEELRPYAYQVINGKKVDVACSYKLEGNQLSYEMPLGYDPCYELIIDPALIFSTYSGSTADNWGNTATFDDNSNLYSGGITNHYSGGTFPATAGAFQTTTQGLWDVAILKFDSTGTDLLYATYLGGSNNEVPQSLIVDGEELIIMGVTGSSNYPTTTGAFDRTYNGGSRSFPFSNSPDDINFSEGTDIFVTRLNASGSSLVASTFIGGSDNDGIMLTADRLTRNYGDQSRGDVFISSTGDIVVATKSKSNDFPVLNAFQNTYAGGETDAVIFSIENDLSQLNWSTYLGGAGMDAAYSVKEKSTGEFVAGGGTTSSDINANFINTYNGAIDGWIASISADGSQLIDGTYVGTGSYDQVYFVDLDINDEVYSYGQSAGAFPIRGSVYSSGGGQFIQKLTSELDSVIWSTKFGSGNDRPDISPTAFLVNECNNIYISGWGGNTNAAYNGGSTVGMPVTADAYQPSTLGSDFYLMTLDADASQLLYATFLGGAESSTHVDGGTSRFDKRGIVYHAVCAGCRGNSDFPTTEGVWSNTNDSPNCNNAAFKFDLASLRAVIQTNNVELNNPGYNNVCLPDSIVFQNLSIGGELFEWNFGDGNETTRTDTAYIVYQYDSPGEYTLTLRAIDPNTCAAEDETSTFVRILDPIQEAIDDQVICFGDDIELRAFGGISYQWLSSDSSFLSSDPSPVVSPEDSTLYFVRIADTFCESLDSVQIDVVPKTAFEYSIEKVYDCFSRPSVKLTNNLTDGDYTWDLGDGTQSAEDVLMYNYEADGTYTIRLIGQRGQCVFQEEVEINVTTIKVPNIFTPSDGAPNERFEIISDRRESLKIYSRWGDLVYENPDYQDEWDGSEVAAGVYFYELIIEDETTCTGWVQVFR